MAELQVPITKGKGTIIIDTDAIPEDVYREALLQGLKILANRGTTKITAETYPNEDERRKAAMEMAEKQKELIMTGKIKFTGQKAKKASGAVMTEARRLARNLVKDEMKRQGIKVSHVEASEITKAANALLEADDSIIKQAEQNIAERDAKIKGTGLAINVKDLIKVSDKKVAAAEAKKAKDRAAKGETLSATQAGKVTARAKGKGAAAQAAQ